MFYANNRTLGYNECVEELSKKIVNTLGKLNIPKISMPKHSYHYVMGILNPKGYDDNGEHMVPDPQVLEYITNLSKIPQLQKIWKEYESELDNKLTEYQNKFPDILNFFQTHFDFQPLTPKFFITRNWDTSGKCIKTDTETYILVGWKKDGINLRQILHEIMHAYVNKCSLTMPENFTTLINKIPKYVFEDYAKPNIILEESLVRALVVYLSRIDSNITNYSLSEDDLAMVLPKKYLEILENNKKNSLFLSYLNTINIE